MSTVAPGLPTSYSLNRSQENSRQSSGNVSSRATPVSSTDGDDENDEDDDEEEEEDDEEEEVEEEEGDGLGNVRFDEKFLAQLLAFDPSSALQPPASTSHHKSTSSQDLQKSTGHELALAAASWPFEIPQSTSLSAQPAFHSNINPPFVPMSAPTPSNEFYDGAINFLTEILGSSSSSSIWNGGAGTSNPGAIDLSWLDQAKTPAGGPSLSAPSPQANGTQFKHLQPLISNLIARLKGHPVEEGMQSGKSLEDDLVVLLQNLMAHRQAQQDRQAQQQMKNGNLAHSNATNSQSTTSVPIAPDQPATASIAASSSFANPGFSIVDFDFGDDDDDPDFIPNSLGFANSKELNAVIANPTHGSMQSANPLHLKEGQEVSEATWQQMMESLQQHASTSTNPQTNVYSLAAPQVSPGGADGDFRRTRSVSRNDDMARNSFGTRAIDRRSPVPSNAEQDDSDGYTPSQRDDNDTTGRKKGRKALSREEALERRRLSNRECARRGRAKKKQEDEEIRVEFERMRKMRSVSQDVVAASKSKVDFTDEDLPAGLRKKKKGRPAGSKTTLDKANNEANTLDAEQVADLKADNRMLRAEMQRLTEENTQLRVRMIHLEERGLKRDRSGEVRPQRQREMQVRDRTRAYNTRARQMERIQTDEEDDDLDAMDIEDPENDDAGFMRQSLASRTLSFDPFKRYQPPTSRARDQGSRLKRAEAINKSGYDPGGGQAREAAYQSIQEMLKDVGNQECPAKSSATMQEIMQKATQAGLV